MIKYSKTRWLALLLAVIMPFGIMATTALAVFDENIEYNTTDIDISSGNRRYGADIVLLYDTAANAIFAAAEKSITVNGVAVKAADFSDVGGKMTIDSAYFTEGFTDDRFCPDFVKFDIVITGGGFMAKVSQYVASKYSQNVLRNGDFTILLDEDDNGWVFDRGDLSTTGSGLTTLRQSLGSGANQWSQDAQRIRLGSAASNLGEAPRDIQLYQDVFLEAGRTYTGYFTLAANPVRSVTVEVGSTSADGAPFGSTQILAPQVHTIPNTTSWVTYRYDIPAQTEDTLVRINVLLGRPSQGGLSGNNRDVFIHNFRLVETIRVNVPLLETAIYGGWWTPESSIVDTAHTTWQGGGVATMDFELLFKPGARLNIEYGTPGTSNIAGLLVRNIVQSGTGQMATTAQGSNGRGESFTSTTPKLAVFTGESLEANAIANFEDGTFSWLNIETGNAVQANPRLTLSGIYVTYFDVPTNPDTVFVGIEVEAGKTAYQLGDKLDLTDTNFYHVFESGRRSGPYPVTPNMIVGFSTAVRSAARPVMVVYPDAITNERPFTDTFNISISGEYNQPDAKRPFPQAGNAGLAVELLRPTDFTQAQMNKDVIDRVRMMIDRGEFLIDPTTAENPDGFRMVVDHNASGTGSAGAYQVTCSESMGYGMMIIALMAGADEELGIDVKAYFDGMFRSVRAWKGSGLEYLMNWEIRTNNKWKQFYGDTWINGASGTATDGSLDMAYAVLLAAEQWGVSDDGVNYLAYAKGMIDEIWRREVAKNIGESGTFFTTAGSWQSPGAATTNYTRPSDHMLHHFKVFALIDTGNDWQSLIDATYIGQLQVVNQQTVPNGLLPDFIRINRTTGDWWTEPGRLLETPQDGDYHWNACRVPWRQGLDVMFSKDTPISESIVELFNTNQFIWSGGDFTRIYGRQMNGVANNLENGFSYDVAGSAFSAPMLIPASIYGPQEWFDNGWQWARTHPWLGDKYGDYITVLAMIAASGNEWSPVAVYEPPVPVVSLYAYNNGTDEQVPSMAGTIRIWTLLDGEGAPIPLSVDDITAVDQNGNDAMRFVTINWTDNRPQDGMVSNFDVVKPQDSLWETIELTITSLGQEVTLTLFNNRYLPPAVFSGTIRAQLDELLLARDVILSTPGNFGISDGNTIIIPKDRTLTVTTVLTVRRGGNLIIEGTLIVAAGGRINNDGGNTPGGGTITVLEGGKLENNGHVELVSNSSTLNKGMIVNNERFEVRAAAALTSDGVLIANKPLNINRDAVLLITD